MKKKLVGIILGICLSICLGIALIGCVKKQMEDAYQVKCEKYAISIYNDFLSDRDYKDNCIVSYSKSDDVIKIELNDIYDSYYNYLLMDRDIFYLELWESFTCSVDSLCKVYKDNAKDLDLKCDVVIEISNYGKVFYTSVNGNREAHYNI